YHTGMDVEEISEDLFLCTGGYPFLVSRLCKWIDENGDRRWTEENLKTAQKELLKTRNTLFDDLIKNVENYPNLKKLIMSILCDGKEHGYSMLDPVINLGTMFGILKEKNGKVAISNRIFETCLYDYVVSIRARENSTLSFESGTFIKNGRLDMPQVLTKFQELMQTEYRSSDEKCVEKQGRLLFLCFLKPIINGVGFYYVESETRNNTRMDIVVSYGMEEHIIELKLWHGRAYREDGIRQLEGYMESRGADRGYLLSFSFGENKEYRKGWLGKEETQGKIFEVVV
ncbi:MAG: AAA family ATPase, partial [Lachnospiraceae bacterium]|nr:AAA family ATPase [Lachnospiraceae bacterium]